MQLTKTLILTAALTAGLGAQTQLVRGDVDGIRNTVNQFQLDCTTIPLTSATVNLQQLHDQSRQQDIEYELQVRNVGTAANPILDVVSATVIPEMFQMGNLRFGRSETWEVFGTPGATAYMFVDAMGNTRYQPLGAAGTWLLSSAALPVASGPISAIGRFQIRFTMPSIPALVGQTFVGQGAIVDRSTLTITNADCKEVRND